MEIKEKYPEQVDPAERTSGSGRGTRGPLDRLALIAFSGFALMYFVVFFYALLVAQAFIAPILVEAILVLLAAGVVATRWRWAPHLGAVVALLTLYDPIFQPHDAYVFTHPGQSNYEFSLIVLVIAFGLVSLVACTAKVIRTHRGSGIEPRFPRLVDRLLSGFAGIVAGMIILSLVVTIVPQTSAVSASTNGQPVVHLTVDTFTPNAVVVPKGERLLIVDDSSVEHILQKGSRHFYPPESPLRMWRTDICQIFPVKVKVVPNRISLHVEAIETHFHWEPSVVLATHRDVMASLPKGYAKVLKFFE